MKEQSWFPTQTRRAMTIVVVSMLIVVISGCAALKPKPGDKPADAESVDKTSETSTGENKSGESDAEVASGSEEEQSKGTQPSQPEMPKVALESDLLYNILLGEVAAQREDVDTSLSSFKAAALESRDPRLIGRATRLAIASGNFDSAFETAKIWAEIRPDSDTPLEALAIVHLARDENDAASETFEQIITAARPDVGTSYRRVSEILSRQEDKAAMVEMFEGLVAKNADNAEAWYSLAFLASRSERDDLAGESIEKAIELRPDWEDAALFKSGYLIRAEKLEEYDTYAHEFLRSYPDSTQFRISYARALVDQGKTDGALDQFKRAMKSDPENADAAYAIGILSLQEEKYEQSSRYFERTLELHPDNDQARLYLGQVATEIEDYDGAEKWYKEVVSDEYRLEAQRLLGLLKADRGEVEPAIEHLSALSPSNDDERVQIYLTKEQIYREAERYENAKTVLDEALVLFPENSDLLYARALVAAQLSMIDVHEADLRKLINNEPENAHAYNALGYTLADQTDRYTEALDLVEKALELRPDDPFIIDSMGWVQYRLGNIDEALEYLTKAHDTRADAEIAAHLGEVLWSAGNRRQAKGIWKKALKQAPENKVLLDTIKKHDAL